jgi:hypothetical protein
VAGFDPASPRGHDAELHLAVEHFGPMAVAVDGDGRTCRDGAAGEGAIEIQVRRRTVDLDERPGLDGGLEQPLVIELVTGSIGNEAIGGMRHHRR